MSQWEINGKNTIQNCRNMLHNRNRAIADQKLTIGIKRFTNPGMKFVWQCK
jgi:hypothetical protein